MPVAIAVFKDDTVPAILSAPTEVELIASISSLAKAPNVATKEQAIAWLLSLPSPSGWFDSVDQAKARVAQHSQPLEVTSEQIKSARKALGLSQAEFARALGVGGNDNTLKTTTFNLEKGKLRMNQQRIATMHRLLSEKGISEMA